MNKNQLWLGQSHCSCPYWNLTEFSNSDWASSCPMSLLTMPPHHALQTQPFGYYQYSHNVKNLYFRWYWAKAMWYGILFDHKKEQNNAIWSNTDGPRGYHTEWSKSERERQISYGITSTWILKKKKRYKWTYLQNRNRLTDFESKLTVTKWERGGGIH